MGFAKASLQFIARQHRQGGLGNSVLTLGRQGVMATLDETRQLLKREGIEPATLPAEFNPKTNIPDWHHGRFAKFISDVAFFRLLGVNELVTLDVSNYEGAEIVWDLNQPVPEHYHEQFDTIIDGGTLEHVFDVRQALMNLVSMLRAGGRIIHISPANNYANHGFFQFSPTFFFDYYAANDFTRLKGFLAEQDLYFYARRPWEFFEITGLSGRVTSQKPLMLFFVAEKTKSSTNNRIPTQAFYQSIFNENRGNKRESISWEQIKSILPPGLKMSLLRLFPMLDLQRKPWGQKRHGRLG